MTQRFVIEMKDEFDEEDSTDLSILLEEVLERYLPEGTTYLLLEYEDKS